MGQPQNRSRKRAAGGNHAGTEKTRSELSPVAGRSPSKHLNYEQGMQQNPKRGGVRSPPTSISAAKTSRRSPKSVNTDSCTR
ncbi:hypothetical protein NG791_02710 [Laspinema sp. D1]|uniref:hypothetical protein n=1 Tax=Laspinema palackyanum TaxID=3231601 RepID=UPI00348A7794|nr:hypothetical protein [Laspinema sp. D2b]